MFRSYSYVISFILVTHAGTSMEMSEDLEAYTAADALTQFAVRYPPAQYHVTKIEPKYK